MRDTKQILRSSCMSCDCEEFKLKSSSNQCSVCNCYATSHYKVDEIAGAFDIPHVEIKKGLLKMFVESEFWLDLLSLGTTTSSWFGRQKKRPTTSSSKHFQWYSINGVESITLTMTQQQIFLGVLGLAILVFTGILLPLRTGLALGSLFRLRFSTYLNSPTLLKLDVDCLTSLSTYRFIYRFRNDGIHGISSLSYHKTDF